MSEPRSARRRAPARRWKLRGWVVLLAVLAVVLGSAGTAGAHAELISTSPTAGSVVATPPTQLVLRFSEDVDSLADSIRVLADDGREVPVGEIRRDLGAETIAADLPTDMAGGTYVVAWRAISGDSHQIGGAFVFSVGAPSTVDPSIVDDALADNEPERSAELWLAFGRWASYLGIAVVVGAAGVLGVCFPAGLRSRRGGLLLLTAAGTAIVGTAVMISAQASLSVHDALGWGDVIDTRSGRWWFARLVAVVAVLAVVLARRRLRRTPWWSFAFAVGSLGLLALVAAGGHAASGRLVAAGFLATVVHLAAMATWAGGLAGIAAVVPRSRMVAVAMQFSPMALASVLALATTGVVNAWRQSSSWTNLVESNYGAWLIVKLVLLAAVLAIAGVGRWLLSRPDGGDDPRALRRTFLAEAVGMLLVMSATAGLVESPPPSAAAGTAATATATVIVGSRSAQVVLDPPVSGGTTMHVYVDSLTGSLDDPRTITVRASLPAEQIGPIDIPVTVEAPGHVTGYDANLPLPGEWTFTISARYGEFEQVDFSLTLPVR